MIRLSKIVFAGLGILMTFYTGAQQLAFPGAEGYGRFASGGRGDGTDGRVVEVTNLEDDVDNPPEGSLRWAFKQAIDRVPYPPPLPGYRNVERPITIVFRVGGVINLKGELRVERDNVTIAGQTAPGDGICIGGATVNFSGSNNVIVRYIRSRPGDELGLETSAFRIENGGNFIIDHCSFSWAIEETTHFSSSDNLTVQWCIISESLFNSIHKKGERGYATQWGGEYASYHHNLLAHHNSRMPRINGSNKNDIEALVDYRNNVNYNWGSTGAFYGGEFEGTNGQGFCHTNVVNNYFIPGPATSSTVIFARPSYNRSGVQVDGYAGWYFNGNVMDGYENLTNDNWVGVDGSNIPGGNENIRSDVEFVQSDGVLEDYDAYTETAEEAMESVFQKAGAIYPVRDTIDKRIIAEARGEIAIVRYNHTTDDGQNTPKKGTSSGIIDTQQNLVPEDEQDTKTAWDVYTTTTDAPLDADHDGMADDWETANGLNPADPSDRNKFVNSGYTCLEVYLSSLAGEEIALDTVISEKKVHDFVVAKDGSGDFTSINDAIDAVPEDGKRYSIFVKKGIYEEKIFVGNKYQSTTKIISMIGENVDSVVITWDDYRNKEIPYPGKDGTIIANGGDLTTTMLVTSPDFYMENVTVKNPSTVAQAEALFQSGDRQILKNCKLIGNQDTHATKKGRRFFYFRSTIEGDVDFIYAGGTCYFYQCDIVSNDGGYITAPEDVPQYSTLSSGKKLRYGFFFKDCDIVAADGVNPGSVYLGRPWNVDAGSVFLNCRLGSHIKDAGWNEWGGRETSASFAEYRSMNADGSELADVSNRVDWSMQLTTGDVNNFMLLTNIYNKISTSKKFNPVPMVIAPASPKSLNVDGNYLTWKAVDNAKGYVIYANGTVVGFNKTAHFVDTLSYDSNPVYTVRTVGPHGNLSMPNGQSEDFTEESIIEAIDTPIHIVGIDEHRVNEKYTPKIENGFIHFDTTVSCRVFSVVGQELAHRENISGFNLDELSHGVFIFLISDEDSKYSFKIVN